MAATLVAVTVAFRSPWPIVVVAGASAALRRWPWAAALGLLGTFALVRGATVVDSLAPRHLGPFTGWARVVGDPSTQGGASRMVLEIGGERFEAWVRGHVRRQRVALLRAGDVVAVSGQRRTLAAGRAARVRWQHVVGTLDVEWLGDRRDGTVLARSANRVHAVIAAGSSVLRAEHAALLRGLVVGDDRDQPPDMVERFRRSGLAHLTAVSGQNVAFTLAAVGPLLRRGPPFARWVLTLVVIGWFVVLTRAEPSVLRAGTMAALSATAFVLGRAGDPLRLLALAVVGLVLADPLLVWSIGFWLSVGATAGVCSVGPWLARRLTRLGPLAPAVGITVGAQVGVALPSLVVFGRLSLVGTVANLLAVPVAGFVMLYGLPATLLAGLVPAVAPVVMTPVAAAVAWIDAVAGVAARLEPRPPWSWLGWLLLTAALAWAMSRPARAAAVR